MKHRAAADSKRYRVLSEKFINKYSIDTDEYDIVEGPMADDTIWNFVNDYLDGNISKEVFWEYAKFKHPTHQISFHSIRALSVWNMKGVR